LKLIKTFSFFLLSIFSFNVFAGGGFTWASSLIHGLHLPIEEYVLTFVISSLILLIITFVYRSALSASSNSVVPDKGITLRNVVESYGQFIYNQCRTVIGEKEGPEYFSFVATIFIVILINNLIGLIPGFLPPTDKVNTTLALGVFSFLYYNYVGCKKMGVITYLKHFAGPLWYMAVLIFPIEIISNFVRPVSLALRLRGNMYGDHLVLSVFSDMAPLLIPIVFMILGILVSFIQAYVFTALSMVYISLASAHHDHDEHH
jgi:F-type H+-transporting ATPase subunit a